MNMYTFTYHYEKHEKVEISALRNYFPRVSTPAHRDSCDEVEVSAALSVPKENALSARHHHGGRGVVGGAAAAVEPQEVAGGPEAQRGPVLLEELAPRKYKMIYRIFNSLALKSFCQSVGGIKPPLLCRLHIYAYMHIHAYTYIYSCSRS